MENNPLLVEKLDSKPDGECPRCGEWPCFPWTVEGIENGYIDSCDKCVQYVARDTLEALRS